MCQVVAVGEEGTSSPVPGDVLKRWAEELGFDRIGVTSALEPVSEDHERYSRFIDRGMHGQMAYLADHADVRRQIGPAILEDAKSVIVVAERYAVEESSNGSHGVNAKIAKYARGRDYHNHFRKRLRKLAKLVSSAQLGARSRALCDTAPILERAWARRAGIGFIGKNGLLICPGLGSFVVLGEVVTTVALEPLGKSMDSRCGACTRCIDACPTGAIVEPFVLDARKCVSYQTIELRGSYELSSLRRSSWLFGCDTCQDVCPYNHGRAARIPPGGAYDPLKQWLELEPVDLLRGSDDEIERWCVGSPLKRAKPDELRRNAIAVLSRPLSSEAASALAALSGDPTRPSWLRQMAREALSGGGSERDGAEGDDTELRAEAAIVGGNGKR